MTFKEWLKKIEEMSTSTGDVAIFARPVLMSRKRKWPNLAFSDDSKDKNGKDCKKNM